MPHSSHPKFIYLLTLAERHLHGWIKNNTPADFPSSAQAGVLFLLDKSDGLLMGEISERLHLVPSAISGLIQRMEHAEFIQKRSCSDDARASRVYLTEKGKTILPLLITHTQQLNQQLLGDMSPEEAKIVERWLNRVIQQFPTTAQLNKSTGEPHV